MKKSKKKITVCLLGLAIGIALLGQVVYAGTVGYDYTLPATGSFQTNNFTKTTSRMTASNRCTYFEKSNATVNEWIENDNGADLTVTGSYSGAITSKFGYLTSSAATNHVGKTVHCILKTNLSTWTSCRVSGTIDADYQ